MMDRQADDRRTWENSSEARASVDQRLRDWGWHMFGGEPRLGYPDHANFATPPKRDHGHYQPEHGPDDADTVERVITTAAQASLQGMRNLAVLRLQYVRRDLPQSEKARRISVSRRTFRRRVDEARFWFWRVSQQLDEPARALARRA